MTEIQNRSKHYTDNRFPEAARILDSIGRQILRTARDELYFSMRFLDVALSSLGYEMDPEISQAGTDGRNIYFHPRQLGGLYKENRILVKYGLKRLEQTKNTGYRALLAVNGLEGKKLTAYHIGFVIGPCINASGRLDTARRALQLLGAETKAEAEELAGDLKALNDSRKDLTVKGTQQAVQMIEETDLKQDRVLVVYLPDCHESLAGIIAGRIREKYFRPCFVLTDAEDGVKGSGRSIPGYHMFDEMTSVRELFTKYGGHPMAAGLSLKPENVEPLRRALNENYALTEEELTPQIAYDAVLPICYAGEQIIRELELLEPFGKANEKPLFAAANLKVRSARIIGKNQNVLKAALEGPDGTRVDTISFGDVQENLAYIEGKQDVCILYYPEINEYQGRRSVQLVVESWR